MENTNSPSATLSDTDLIVTLTRLVANERDATTAVLRLLMEFDTRRLYLGEGYPSMFAYCTQVLHYAEHAAFNRIEVARAGRRFPMLLDRVEKGELTLTAARLLAPHITAQNVQELLRAARHRTKREIEELIAALKTRPDVKPLIRKVSCPATSLIVSPLAPNTSDVVPEMETAVISPPARVIVAPLAAARYSVQFTITRETRDKLREVQDLMRHTIPNGDLAAIFDRALTILLEDLRRKRFAATARPHSSRGEAAHNRHVPAAVRRAVWQRDGGRCAFVGSHGRCSERGFLEFHHVVPFAAGGATTAENLELRCSAHNAYEASLFFSAEDVDSAGEGASQK